MPQPIPRLRLGLLTKICAAVAIGFWSIVVVAAQAADPIFPPASRIGLVPPAGMIASTKFQGFEDRSRNAVVVVSERAAQSYGKIAQEFTTETLQAEGFQVESRESFRASDRQGVLVVARQEVGGVPMRKWALILLADDVTAIVIVVLPESARVAYPDAAIRATLMSFTLRPKLSAEELLAPLPYRVGDLGGFRPLNASLDGTVVLTYGPEDTSLPAQQPFFLIAARPGTIPPVAEHDRFARRVLAQLMSTSDLRLVESQALRLGGGEVHEIVAETTDKATGAELEAVQWLRFGTSGYLQMLGMARKDAWETAFPRMRTLRDSVAPKEPP